MKNELRIGLLFLMISSNALAEIKDAKSNKGHFDGISINGNQNCDNLRFPKNGVARKMRQTFELQALDKAKLNCYKAGYVDCNNVVKNEVIEVTGVGLLGPAEGCMIKTTVKGRELQIGKLTIGDNSAPISYCDEFSNIDVLNDFQFNFRSKLTKESESKALAKCKAAGKTNCSVIDTVIVGEFVQTSSGYLEGSCYLKSITIND